MVSECIDVLNMKTLQGLQVKEAVVAKKKRRLAAVSSSAASVS